RAKAAGLGKGLKVLEGERDVVLLHLIGQRRKLQGVRLAALSPFDRDPQTPLQCLVAGPDPTHQQLVAKSMRLFRGLQLESANAHTFTTTGWCQHALVEGEVLLLLEDLLLQ